MIAPQTGGTSFRSALLGALVIAVCGALLGVLVNIEDPFLGATIGAGGLFIAAASVIGLVNWRLGLGLLLMVVLCEDTVRKAMPGTPMYVNLAKDFIIVSCYLSYFFGKERKTRDPMPREFRKLVFAPIALWAAFLGVQCLNPSVGHPLVAISGLRTWFLAVPMMILVARLMDDPVAVIRFLRWVCVLAIPFLALALAQNRFGTALPEALNNSAFASAHTLETGDWIGYNESIFSNPSLYALSCVFHLCLVVGLLKLPQPRRWVITLWICGYCAVAGSHISGVRTGLMFAIIAIACLSPLVLYTRSRLSDGRSVRRMGLIMGGVFGLIIGYGLFANMKETRLRAFVTSFDLGLVETRMDSAISATNDFGGGLLGHGTGMAGKSGRVMSLVGQPSPSNERVEWGTALVKYSFGDIGLWFGAFVMAWLFLGLLRLATRFREQTFAPLRFALWVYLCAQMSWYLFKNYPILENGSMMLMFWCSAGVLLGAYRLDKREFEMAQSKVQRR